MLSIKTRNLTTLWTDLMEVLRENPNLVPNGKGFNFRGDFYIHIYDVMFRVKHSTAPGLFLEDVGYSSRGSKIISLIGHYLESDQVNKWITYIKENTDKNPHVAGDILLRTKQQVKKEIPGGCITSLVYRAAPEPHLTVLSRSIEMPTKGMADMLLVSSICRLLEDRLGVKDISIRWYFLSAWTRTRTAFYYVINQWPNEVKFENSLFQAYLDKRWKKYYLSDYEFSFQANIRAKLFYTNKRDGLLTHELDEDAFYVRLKEYLNED